MTQLATRPRALATWHAFEGAADRWASWGALAVAGVAVILVVLAAR